MRANPLLDVFLDLLENLSRENNDRGRAIAYLGVLGSRNIDENLCGRVDDIEQLLKRYNVRYH
jgi:hypothetical protein